MSLVIVTGDIVYQPGRVARLTSQKFAQKSVAAMVAMQIGVTQWSLPPEFVAAHRTM